MRIGKLIWYEIKAFFQDFILLLLAPILPLILIAALFPLSKLYLEESGSTTSFRVAIADETGSIYTRLILSNLRNALSLNENIELLQVEKAEAEQMVLHEEIAAALIIPSDFIEGLQNGDIKPLTVLMGSAKPFQGDLFLQGLKSGSASMAMVQKEVYVFAHFLRLAGFKDAEFDEAFNKGMMHLIMGALGRDNLYKVIYLSPWKQTPLPLYYGIFVLLLFMAFFSIYHVTKRNRVAHTWLYRRIHLSKMRVETFLFVDTFSTACIVSLQGMILYTGLLMVRSSGFRIEDLLGALLLISVAFSMVLFAAILDSLTNRRALMGGLLVGMHIFLLLISGLFVPVAFWGSIPSEIRYVSPYYYWGELMLRILAGASTETETHSSIIVFLGIPALLFIINGGIIRAKRYLF